MQAGPPRPHRARELTGTVSAVHAVVHASTLVLPPLLLGVQREFRVGLGEVALAANAIFFAQALTGIPGGALADRLGAARTMALSSFGCAVGAALVSLAPSFLWVVLGLVVIGAAAGLHEPSGLSLLTRQIGAHRHGRAVSIHGIGGAIGEATAPLLAAGCAVVGGWRTAFAATGFAALAGAVAAFRLVRDDVYWQTQHHRSHRADGATHVVLHAGARAPRATDGSSSSSRSATIRALLLIAVGVTSAFAMRGALTFLPWHVHADTAGAHLLAGAGATTLMLAGAVAAQLAGGTLADRLPRAALLFALAGLAPVALTIAAVSSGPVVLGAIAVFGFAAAAARPVLATQIAKIAPAERVGILFGLQSTLSSGASSFAASIGGALAMSGGTSVAFLCFAGVACTGALVALAHATWARAAHSLPAPRPQD